jgi:uncharacterized membrane protein YqjE
VAGPTPEESPAASRRAGFFAHVLDLLAAGLAYFQARLSLAGIEGREAAVQYLKALALFVGGLVALIFGYFFICFAVVFAIAMAFGGGNAWIWVTLGAAILHVGGAVILLSVVRALIVRPVFEATLDELKKDQTWLKTKTARRS